MLRKLIAYAGVLAILSTVACRRSPATASDARGTLVGRWELKMGSDCSDYDIQSDILVLHSDGTFEQHVVSSSGAHYDATNEHWSYVPDNAVSFDARRNFFSRQQPNLQAGVSIHETLIVEFGDPSVILLNPDSNCFYRKM
ncbi:MAG: hypothetical protein JWO13_2002 [Acidobacteriales bacterium]|nr:hypothetical protein [Terriglobales bacterium]